MNNQPPRKAVNGKPGKESENAPGREGGDDALENASPTDDRADEKVIVNEQREDKIVNAPSQTAANTSEGNSFDEEIIDRS